MRVVLASQSPRRRELLSLVGIPHEVQPADIDETPWPDEMPVPHAERLAKAKANVIAMREPDAVVIAADTIVVIDGDILGKPTDAAAARTMLRRLSGRTHEVYTAVAVATGLHVASDVVRVEVRFRPLDARYGLAQSEPHAQLFGLRAEQVDEFAITKFKQRRLPVGHDNLRSQHGEHQRVFHADHTRSHHDHRRRYAIQPEQFVAIKDGSPVERHPIRTILF